MGLPAVRRTELVSYGGERVVCELATPRDGDELAELFEACRRGGRTATLRGAGLSLDGQALNRDLVISLARFGGLTIDAGAARARAGAATTWGELTTAALAHGCLPPVVVSTTGASVGGTLASNSFSRFTPVRGKEIRHVASLDLLTTRGERLVCDPAREPEVFRGVVGGLGYLGAVTAAELALDRGAPRAMRTRVVGVLPVDEVIAGLVPPPGGGTAGTPSRYAVLLPGLRRGLLYEARTEEAPERWHRYRPVHQPRSWLQVAGQMFLRARPFIRLTWWLGARTWSRRDYVDPILDFTFMMDGNWRLMRLGRRLGFAMRAIQQTFVVPPPRVGGFLADAAAALAAARLTPSLTDLLFIPADDGVLSSSRDLDGYAVTFGFETSRASRRRAIHACFTALARRCADAGGRVHLTKNVIVEPDVLAAMYGDALPRFRALKRRLDPDGILRNEFLRRHFPSLEAD